MELRGTALRLRTAKCTVVLAGFVLSGALGVLDYYTGQELVLSALYVLPLVLVTWYAGRAWGASNAIVSAVIWLTVDIVDYQHTNLLYLLLNAAIFLTLFLVVVYLMGKLHRAMQRLEDSSHQDSLTGALTSDFFYECLDKESERLERYGHPLTLAYLDLDGFKAVNDHFGHPTGDDVLRRVVNCVRSRLRKTDLVARLGGDEFVFLCPETDEVAARSAVTEVVARLTQEMRLGGWPITFSIGVITCYQAPGSSAELVQMADKQMYSVKLTTKDGVSYETYGRWNGESASRSGGVLRRMRSRQPAGDAVGSG